MDLGETMEPEEMRKMVTKVRGLSQPCYTLLAGQNLASFAGLVPGRAVTLIQPEPDPALNPDPPPPTPHPQ